MTKVSLQATTKLVKSLATTEVTSYPIGDGDQQFSFKLTKKLTCTNIDIKLIIYVFLSKK